jgi:hypothetical protein
MTMLTHTGGSLKPAHRSADGEDAAGTVPANALLAMIRRFGISALSVLAVGGTLAAIIALKATLFVWVFHYY